MHSLSFKLVPYQIDSKQKVQIGISCLATILILTIKKHLISIFLEPFEIVFLQTCRIDNCNDFVHSHAKEIINNGEIRSGWET